MYRIDYQQVARQAVRGRWVADPAIGPEDLRQQVALELLANPVNHPASAIRRGWGAVRDLRRRTTAECRDRSRTCRLTDEVQAGLYGGGDPVAECERREVVSMIRDAEYLSAEQRTYVRMTLDGQPPESIAMRTGVRPIDVSRSLAAAVEVIRERMS